jgi:uncharacterized protein
MTVFQPSRFILIPVWPQGPGSITAAGRMGPEAARAVTGFIERVAPPKGDIIVSFRGGDPLLADRLYFEQTLRLLREKLGRRLRPHLRSSLLALDDRMIALIREYEIAVSTDIETDEEICDAQRGEGYFAKTHAAVRRLEDEGVEVEEISTLTPRFAGAAYRIFGSFGDAPVTARPYRIEGTVPMPDLPALGPALSASEMTAVLTDTLMKYGSDIARRRVFNLDEMARGLLTRRGVACTFSDCLGHVAAVAPDGRIYPCDHLIGNGEFSLGSVFDEPDAERITSGAAYKKLLGVQEAAHGSCGGCKHTDYCRGGCPANAVAAGAARDPYCDAYHTTFDIMSLCMQWERKALDTGRITEKDAPMLAMAGAVPHPNDLLKDEIGMRLALRHGAPDRGGYPASRKDRAFPENRRRNVYLHITLHDLSEYDTADESTLEMTAGDAAETAAEAAAARFRNIIVTGGEPLLYGELDILLDKLARLDLTGTGLALHTSLGTDIPEEQLKKICAVFDAVVVNVEDDWTSPEALGIGRYEHMARHLAHIRELGYMDKVSLCAAFTERRKNGAEGDALREYGRTLGIREIRFIAPLPARLKGTPASSVALCAEERDTGGRFQPRFACGLGRCLSVESDGSVYPCCACRSPGYYLGSVKNGLPSILNSDAFREYRFHDVDSNKKCRNCGVRYLCGGMCRAWVPEDADIDSGDFDCTGRKAQYEQIAAMIEM